MFNKTRINIENRLATNDIRIQLNDYVDDLILPYVKNGVHPSFEEILKSRKISGPFINENISTDAFIKLEDNQFILTTKKALDFNKPSDRILFAHEIAHTFLYTIKSGVILDTFLFNKSSMEQEFFCDFFARAYLIPTNELKRDLDGFNALNSLKLFNELCLKYNVPYPEIIKRILNDLELFRNIVIIRFIKFKENENWKIFETFMSENIKFDKTFFIPKNNFKKEVPYTDRFPTCSDVISAYFDRMFAEITFKDEIELFEEFGTKLSELPLRHFSKNLTSTSTFIITKSENKKYHNKIINLMITI